MNQFLNQGHAEDVIQRHRYCYYVLGAPLIGDQDYDALERRVKARWSVGLTSHSVGSSNARDYPEYIREGRRPDLVERGLRDREIMERWLRFL